MHIACVQYDPYFDIILYYTVVLSPMSALAKVKMNVRTEVDLSLPQVHSCMTSY